MTRRPRHRQGGVPAARPVTNLGAQTGVYGTGVDNSSGFPQLVATHRGGEPVPERMSYAYSGDGWAEPAPGSSGGSGGVQG